MKNSISLNLKELLKTDDSFLKLKLQEVLKSIDDENYLKSLSLLKQIEGYKNMDWKEKRDIKNLIYLLDGYIRFKYKKN